MVFESYLFLLAPGRLESLNLPLFYKGLFKAWQLLQSAEPDQLFFSLWLLEQLLCFNPLFPTEALSSRSLFSTIKQAGLT